ncbi:hypothetical protein QHH11_25345 [Aphanizomenon sp. PH219]|nr:hypothetical protein [Aphanizomenon sp. 202]MDK2462402.1 hypothetical protein [Aphanizomenon sp. PH219]
MYANESLGLILIAWLKSSIAPCSSPKLERDIPLCLYANESLGLILIAWL